MENEELCCSAPLGQEPMRDGVIRYLNTDLDLRSVADLTPLATLFTSIRDPLMLISNVFGEIAFQTKAFRALCASKRFQFEMHRLNVSIEALASRKH